MVMGVAAVAMAAQEKVTASRSSTRSPRCGIYANPEMQQRVGAGTNRGRLAMRVMVALGSDKDLKRSLKVEDGSDRVSSRSREKKCQGRSRSARDAHGRAKVAAGENTPASRRPRSTQTTGDEGQVRSRAKRVVFTAERS